MNGVSVSPSSMYNLLDWFPVGPALEPIQMLLEPVVMLSPAPSPIAMLLSPLDRPARDSWPIAMLSLTSHSIECSVPQPIIEKKKKKMTNVRVRVAFCVEFLP